MTIKQQIFNELDGLENHIKNLRNTANVAGKQTDLEVAILDNQIKTLRDKNARANELIDNALGILRGLK